jgi:hypothetical protein
MKYTRYIQAARNNPQLLEHFYRSALQAGEGEEFRHDLLHLYRLAHATAPSASAEQDLAEPVDGGDVLLEAWYHRLAQPLPGDPDAPAARRAIPWRLALPLCLLNGVALVLLWSIMPSGSRLHTPFNLFLSVVCAWFLIAFITLAARRGNEPAAATGAAPFEKASSSLRLPVGVGVTLLLLSLYVILVAPHRPAYRDLMTTTIPIISGLGVAFVVVGLRLPRRSFFAFLKKVVEALITGGVFAIAGGIFFAMMIGLFESIDVQVPYMEQIAVFGVGLLPVLVFASVYDPTAPPLEQDFTSGIGRTVTPLLRMFLPLSALVLLVFIAYIPFNFMEPFYNREVLFVFNALLFLIVGLLVGASPVPGKAGHSALDQWIQLGMQGVALLAALVSVYALAAVVYRTGVEGLTANRLALTGWNVTNIGVLVLVLLAPLTGKRLIKAKQPPAVSPEAAFMPPGKSAPVDLDPLDDELPPLSLQPAQPWWEGLYFAYRVGAYAYVIWAVFLLLAIPWIVP